MEADVVRVIKVVDVYLVLFDSKVHSERALFVQDLLEIFETSASGFTSENPVEGTLQF